jgi:hypothetical protein
VSDHEVPPSVDGADAQELYIGVYQRLAAQNMAAMESFNSRCAVYGEVR